MRNRSYASRSVARACGLEFLLRPPSRLSHARTSFSQASKLSGSASCEGAQGQYGQGSTGTVPNGSRGLATYDFGIELPNLSILLVRAPIACEVAHPGEWCCVGRLRWEM